MKEYHKINTVFKRDMATKNKTLIFGDFSLPEFEYLQGNEWVWTEKVDGTNIRVMFDGERITFGGKTDNAQIPAHLIAKLEGMFLPQLEAFKFRFAEQAQKDRIEVCLYGEGYGEKIQKGGKYGPVDFVLFDVKVGRWWLQRDDVRQIAEGFGLRYVPIIGQGTLYEMVEKVKDGFDSMWGPFPAEGIVARPSVELVARNGGRIITKIKHVDFVRLTPSKSRG